MPFFLSATLTGQDRLNQLDEPENKRKAEKVHFRHLAPPKTNMAVAPVSEHRHGSVCGLGFYKTPLCRPFVFGT